MGYAQASAYAELEQEGQISLRMAVGSHMTSNLYPPPPSFMTAVAIAAIEAVRDGESDTLIDLPEGVLWREESHVPAHAVIDSFRLDAFV